MYKGREPALGALEYTFGGFSFYLSPAISGNTVEHGIVDICCAMNGEPFTYTPLENGNFMSDKEKPGVYLDGPFLKLPFNTQESYRVTYFPMVRTTARELLKLYFKQGPQKATLCFMWIGKRFIHKDVIKHIAHIVWASRSEKDVWADANRFFMPY